MKAVLSDEPFSDPDWIFERKLDGIRCIAHRDGSGVRLLSRTDRDMSGGYPELVAALESQPAADFVIDGEVVALDSRGVTSFQRLQRRGKQRVAIYLYVFDLLRHEGADLRALPLRERKAALRKALRFEDPIRYTPHRNRDGERLFEEACRKGLEGIIAKRAESRYTATRSRDWLKLKCHAEQELVIGGYTAPQGSRTDFGALLVGYYEGRAAALRGQGRHGLRPVHARRARLGAARGESARTVPSPTPSRSRARRIGSSRSWWRRSAFRSGPGMAACAIRAISACATTSPPDEVVRERPG